MTNRFEYGLVGTLLDTNNRPVGQVTTGKVHNVIECSALLCLKLVSEEVPSFQAPADPRVHIDDIDSFSKVRDIKPPEIADYLNSNGRINLAEKVIKEALADILAVSPVKNDWGGEDDDFYTSNLSIKSVIGDVRAERALLMQSLREHPLYLEMIIQRAKWTFYEFINA